MASSCAVGDHHVIDSSCLSFGPAPLSNDGAFTSTQWAGVDWPRSLRLRDTSLGLRMAQGHLHDREGMRNSTGRDPPPYARSAWTAYGPRFVSSVRPSA